MANRVPTPGYRGFPETVVEIVLKDEQTIQLLWLKPLPIGAFVK